MNFAHFKFLVLFNALKNNLQSNLTEVVYTDKGPVQGEFRTTVQNKIKYSAFRGIRYGKPPVGYARFKPPEEADPWRKVFNATSEATPCPQRDIINKVYVGDEDCLNLNVYTPKTNFKKTNDKLLPVMVWLHGGGFYSGWTNISFFGPDFLIEEKVVVVAVNYRLGALGFLALNHTNATGNAGLKDQLLALKWVNKNIKKFGGDPNLVTLFGHSAGGVSVDYHILSKASKGLFHRSISMSGSHYCQWAYSRPKEAESQAFNLAFFLHLNITDRNKDELLTSLYKIPPQDIVEATRNLHNIDLPFKPTLEDPLVAGDSAFYSQCSDDIYKSGNFSHVPHMTGFMKDEALTIGPGDSMLMIKKTLNEGDRVIKNSSNFLSFPWKNFYAYMVTQGASLLLTSVSEAAFIKDIDAKQQIMTQYSTAPVYFYGISFTSTISIHERIHHINMKGAAHEDELAYFWYVSLLEYPEDPKNPFIIMKNRITRMWTNFAKYGNPTPDGESDPLLGIKWTEAKVDGKFLDINEDLTMKKNSISAASQLFSYAIHGFGTNYQCSNSQNSS
ncbi:pyrethroid hydrolase Ces2a-like [Chelonus insularis]|uniref:pyrethroid hydrolase Ces2a-like n=1 Tax=Chelonus insularis TaxID=460826 RepID=UPI00158D61E9|nr:pyrethroid hydrolase Ces2a-like [Chelonus insularis]